MVSFQRVCLINATILEEEFTKCHIVLYTGLSASMFSNEDLLTNVGYTFANMLSLSYSAKRCRVVMDSEKDQDIKVEIASGACMRFVLNGIGLHVNDVGDNN